MIVLKSNNIYISRNTEHTNNSTVEDAIRYIKNQSTNIEFLNFLYHREANYDPKLLEVSQTFVLLLTESQQIPGEKYTTYSLGKGQYGEYLRAKQANKFIVSIFIDRNGNITHSLYDSMVVHKWEKSPENWKRYAKINYYETYLSRGYTRNINLRGLDPKIAREQYNKNPWDSPKENLDNTITDVDISTNTNTKLNKKRFLL